MLQHSSQQQSPTLLVQSVSVLETAHSLIREHPANVHWACDAISTAVLHCAVHYYSTVPPPISISI
jgi:hypothetical protein